jgi:LysM repeat protein/murein endopeptidase
MLVGCLALTGCFGPRGGAPAAGPSVGAQVAQAPAPVIPVPVFEIHDHEEDDDDGDAPLADVPGLGPSPGARPAPSAGKVVLTDDEIRQKAKTDPASLGSVSIGRTNAGRLVNGMAMPQGDARWAVVDPANAWGTEESVAALIRAIAKVHDVHPRTPKMYIGHWSAKHGGPLRPHKSHQAGRDVDLSYYTRGSARWYDTANAKNLDRERTWTFVKALVQSGETEMILIDTSVQKLLKEHALKAGEDPTWLDYVFQVGSKQKRTIVRHVKGHATHIHVRFRSPEAVRLGVIAGAILAPPPAPPTPTSSKGVLASVDPKKGDPKKGEPAVDPKKPDGGKGDTRLGEGKKADKKGDDKGDPKHTEPKHTEPKHTEPKKPEASKHAGDKGDKGDKAPPREAKPKKEQYVVHRVREGELLHRIAARYGTSVEAIQKANGLRDTKIRSRQVLKIPKG